MQQALPVQQSDCEVAVAEPTSARAAIIINRYLIENPPVEFPCTSPRERSRASRRFKRTQFAAAVWAAAPSATGYSGQEQQNVGRRWEAASTSRNSPHTRRARARTRRSIAGLASTAAPFRRNRFSDGSFPSRHSNPSGSAGRPRPAPAGASPQAKQRAPERARPQLSFAFPESSLSCRRRQLQPWTPAWSLVQLLPLGAGGGSVCS
jgi:hypothetical protein